MRIWRGGARAASGLNLSSAVNHVLFSVGDALFLAEFDDMLVDTRQVVARHLGEQVVLHLILQTPTEPVNERLGDTLAPNDVPSGSHLRNKQTV